MMDADKNDTLQRMLYSLSFFVWTGIILFNIISGLMLDAFASIREDAEKREETLRDSCFVCGIERKDYENLNLPPNFPSFEEHKHRDHDVWSYIYFIDYLNGKDPTEFTGVEQYVYEQLQNNEMLWAPVRMSFAIQTVNDLRTGALVAAQDDEGGGGATAIKKKGRQRRR